MPLLERRSAKPSEKQKVFISYSRHDLAIADAIVAARLLAETAPQHAEPVAAALGEGGVLNRNCRGRSI